MSARPRLLYLASFPPLPAVHGAAVRMWNILRRAGRDFDVTFVAFDQPLLLEGAQENAALVACLQDLCRRVVLVPRSSCDRDDPAAAWMPQTARGAYSARMRAALAETVAAERFDAAHVDFYEMAQYAPLLAGIPAVLTEQDASNTSLRGSFLRSRSAVSAAEGAEDWHKAMRYLYTFFPLFERIIALTEPDRRALKRLLPTRDLALVPTGVDLDRFSFGPSPASEPRLVFVGHYYHYPNEEAITRFAREVWPRVARRRPDVRLDVVGSCPTPAVRALQGPAIDVTGTVSDVRPYLRRAAVFVAPLRLGEGIKGKLLEAFAIGVPVVATTRVARAIGARPGRHLLAADAPADFARCVLRILADPSLGRRLAREARRFVESRYAWPPLTELWSRTVREVAARPDTARPPSLEPPRISTGRPS